MARAQCFFHSRRLPSALFHFRLFSMSVVSLSDAPAHDRLRDISCRLIVMSLNIHVELHDGRFSPSQSDGVQKHADLSLISSSPVNTYIETLFAGIEYYCREINESVEALHGLSDSSVNALPALEDLSKGSQVCLDVLQQYHRDRTPAMQSLLSNPFREDAWRLVHEIDSSMFSKCRIILFRLRIYFLIMHRILTGEVTAQQKLQARRASSHSLTTRKKRRGSSLSISSHSKRGRFLKLKV